MSLFLAWTGSVIDERRRAMRARQEARTIALRACFVTRLYGFHIPLRYSSMIMLPFRSLLDSMLHPFDSANQFRSEQSVLMASSIIRSISRTTP